MPRRHVRHLSQIIIHAPFPTAVAVALRHPDLFFVVGFILLSKQ